MTVYWRSVSYRLEDSVCVSRQFCEKYSPEYLFAISKPIPRATIGTFLQFPSWKFFIFCSERECLNKFSFLRSRFCVRSDSSGDKWNLFSNLITRTMQWCWLCTTAQASPAHNTKFEWEQAPAEILMLIFFQREKRQGKNNRIFISVVANLTWNNLLLSEVLFWRLKALNMKNKLFLLSAFFRIKYRGLLCSLVTV